MKIENKVRGREDRSPDITQASSQLQAEHASETGKLQRAVDRLTAIAGHPAFVGFISLAIGFWIVANSTAEFLKFRPLDPPPFFWLQGAVTTASLYIAALILTTQRRQAELADHRAHLTLEIAILAEQKSAKAIELLEELRRDSPTLLDRFDGQARAMSAPTDHQSVLNALKKGGAQKDGV